MKQEIISITLLVDNYDKAIEYYTQKLGFDLIQDNDLGNGKRWVMVRPKNADGAGLLLAKAKNSEQTEHIGKQSGGRVFLFLQTDNFDYDYQKMKEEGVLFHEEVRQEKYGKVVVFSDLYGNKWDLIENKNI